MPDKELTSADTGLPIRPCGVEPKHERHYYRHDGIEFLCPGLYVGSPVREACADKRVHGRHNHWAKGRNALCDGVLSSHDEYVTTRDHAQKFLESCGLNPTQDAIGQLAEVFLPCLRIMIERGYDPNGATWRTTGWRGNLFLFMCKARRAWHKSWKRGEFDEDSMIDAINFAGFYLRSFNVDYPWGELGGPEDGVC